MAEAAHLQVSGLTKRFGGLVAVKDMSFAVRGGEILGLIGPNGSGKSTVMKLIMGIERPDAGSVRINGTEVAGWPSHKVARIGAGIVFQHSRPLHRQTVLENIKLALLPDKLTRLLADPETDARARAIAARVGLSDAVLGRRPATLPVSRPSWRRAACGRWAAFRSAWWSRRAERIPISPAMTSSSPSPKRPVCWPMPIPRLAA